MTLNPPNSQNVEQTLTRLINYIADQWHDEKDHNKALKITGAYLASMDKEGAAINQAINKYDGVGLDEKSQIKWLEACQKKIKAYKKSVLKDPYVEQLLQSCPSAKDYVIIKVLYTGLCRTDLMVAKNSSKKNLVLGHEFSGVVGWALEEKLIGQLVGVDPLIRTQEGFKFLGLDIDGSLQAFIALPTKQVYVANGILPIALAYLEPVSASLAPVVQLMNQSGWDNKKVVGVMGNNRIAQLTYQMFLLAKQSVVWVSETWELLGTNVADWQEKIGTCYTGELDALVPTVIDQALVDSWVQRVNHNGFLVFKSRNVPYVSIPLQALLEKQINIINAYYAPYPSALKWLKKHQAYLDCLYQGVWPMQKAALAFNKGNAISSKKVFIQGLGVKGFTCVD